MARLVFVDRHLPAKRCQCDISWPMDPTGSGRIDPNDGPCDDLHIVYVYFVFIP